MKIKVEYKGRIRVTVEEKSRDGVEFGAESKEMSPSSAVQLKEFVVGSKNKMIVFSLCRHMQMTQFRS